MCTSLNDFLRSALDIGHALSVAGDRYAGTFLIRIKCVEILHIIPADGIRHLRIHQEGHQRAVGTVTTNHGPLRYCRAVIHADTGYDIVAQ